MAAKAIYKRVVQNQDGALVAGAEFTVTDEISGLALTIYSDRLGATELTPPYFSDGNGRIEFFVEPGVTFRVVVTGPSGSFTDRWVDGVVLGDDAGNVPTITILDARVVGKINSQADLDGFVGAVDGQQISMRGFHPNSDVGGGTWYWKAGEPKANHNGGTKRSPTVPLTGATLANFLDGVGETDVGGTGCWVKLLNGTASIDDFGALADCVGVGVGTDNYVPIQAGAHWLCSSNFRVLTSGGGRYRMSGSVLADLAGGIGHKVIFSGWVTPDSEVVRSFSFYNGTEFSLSINAVQGGVTGDFTQAVTHAGSEFVHLRGIRRAEIRIKARSYKGRVLFTEAEAAEEIKTSDLNIKMTTGERIGSVGPMISDIGQPIYARGSSNWGSFDLDGEGCDYGPVFEDLNDVFIGTVELGRLRNSGFIISGCQVMLIDRLYLGEADAGTIQSPALEFKASAVRSCSRIAANQLRFFQSPVGLSAPQGSFSETAPSLSVANVAGSNCDVLIQVDGLRYADFLSITDTTSGVVLDIGETCRDVSARLNILASSSSVAAVLVRPGASRINLQGSIRGGGEGGALLKVGTTGDVVCADMHLDSATANLIEIDTASATNLVVRGGSFQAGGAVYAVGPDGRRPKMLFAISGYKTKASGIATIPSGQNTVTVSHTLARTPNDIHLLGTGADTASVYVSSVGATTFIINTPSPVAGDRQVYWTASAELVNS